MLTPNRTTLSAGPARSPSSFPFLVVLGCALIGVLALSSCCRSKGQSDLGDVENLPEAARAKLAPDLRRLMADLSAGGHADSVVAVLVQVKAGADVQRDLEQAGLQIDSTIGEVVTGRAAAAALAKVAIVPAVVQIQPAKTYKAGETEQP